MQILYNIFVIYIVTIYIFEIGRRLKHVKENDLVHGEWESWCNEKIKISPSTARKHIKVFEEYKANRLTSNDLGLDALYHIATLPPEEREKDVQIRQRCLI